jgi:phosphatidylserine decarboxylase
MSLGLSALKLVPKNTLSRAAGVFSRSSVSKAVIPWFVKRYDIDLDEALAPEGGFETLHQLFTRPLKEGARAIADAPLVSPADGHVAQSGRVDDGLLVQAKGKDYGMNELLGEAMNGDEAGQDFAFATIYLAPTDYHRLHSPADLLVESVYAVPGTLWPVNPTSVNGVDRLFCINERATLRCRTEDGSRLWIVLVGATIVGGIRLAFEPNYGSNQPDRATTERFVYHQPIALKAGDPLGHFEFGSTAILVWERGLGEPSLEQGMALRVGQALL